MTDIKKEDIFLVDSNILIYNYDVADKGKHEIAKNILDECWKSKRRLAVSSQNLSEMFAAATKKGFVSKKESITDISDIINFHGWLKINFDHNTILEATKLSDEYNMSYWDSLLAATMKQNGILNLYTENKKDFKMPWLNAINPFEKK